MGVRSWRVGLVAALLALASCGQAGAGDPAASISNRGGAVLLAVSETCTPGSGPDCQAVGDEHVVVTPSEFRRVGVVGATAAPDGSAGVDVEFDTDGAAALRELSTRVVQKGDQGRLVLKVDEQVLSAVRVPGAIAVSRLRILLHEHVHPEDVARQIRGG